MSATRKVCGLVAATVMLLSFVTVFMTQSASAASWLTTTDIDFGMGNFFHGSGFETELHGTGVDAYVQNKMDLVSWFEMFPQENPGPRTSFGFTNDSSSGRLLLFGGLDGSFAHNDTWAYNYGIGDWERICADDSPECAPPRRAYTSMAYDNNNRVAVLYGGFASDLSTKLEDTWEFHVNNNTWVNRTSGTGPRGLTGQSMVYDAADKQVILVGRGIASMEVWAYNASGHAWTELSSGGGPSLRSGFALGYNYQANHQSIVLFGGSEVMNVYNDTWEFDYLAKAWSLITPPEAPSSRSGAAMTYSFEPSVEGLILWGGVPSSTETWKYSWVGTSPSWSQLVLVTPPPPPRKGHGMAYEPGHGELMMYGGSDQSGTVLNDTWHFVAGFRLEGKYASRFFNTLYTESLWRYVFWNQTPADVPPNTLIRLQLNASYYCDDLDPAVWRGPDGTSNSYYTVPGTPLWPGLSGNRCIRFLADMITTDPTVAPKLEDVTVCFETICSASLRLISYYPVGPAVPEDSPFYLNFSKPANTSNVHISVIPNVTFDMPWQWHDGDTQVTITHDGDPFLVGVRYDVCVWAADLSGQPMINGKKCWIFTATHPPPFIVSTVPPANGVNVPLDSEIRMTFNEPMNTSTCWPYVTIDKGAVLDGHYWTSGDTVLVMTHSTQFGEFTTYTVDVPIGDPLRPCKDTYGILLTYGPVAVPWPFTTMWLTTTFYIQHIEPMNQMVDVPLYQVTKVTFSQDVEQSEFSYYVKEYDGIAWINTSVSFTLTWQSPRIVLFTHSTMLPACTPYEWRIWAKDTSGDTLVRNPNVPNPWRIQTGNNGGECAPFIMFTDPHNGGIGVPPWENVTIIWYSYSMGTGGMNETSFTFSVTDSSGNDLTSSFEAYWHGMGSTTVDLRHPSLPFSRCTMYTVEVLTAEDTDGRAFIPGYAENPFQFYTDMNGCGPMIIWSHPHDGEVDIGLTDPIIIEFSEPADTTFTMFTLTPDASPYVATWTQGDTNLTIQHRPFEPCTWYTLTLTVYDPGGNWTVNRIRFRTVCGGTFITETYPAHNQMGIALTDPIYVNFSEPMNTSSFVFKIVPSVGILTYKWINGNKTVIIYHSNPFTQCTFYTARVESAKNESGGEFIAGPVPNQWVFRTICCGGAWIDWTEPMNFEQDVGPYDPIIIQFSCAVDKSSFTYYIVPFIVFDKITWPDDSTVRLDHSQPFASGTTYTIWVSVRDLDGNTLTPGPVPNPWSFTVQDYLMVRGLQVSRSSGDVYLSWIPDPAAQSYLVFHANDRMTPWPWAQIGNVTTNSFMHLNAITDMQNHFYIVRSFGGGKESANSTMGALWHMQAAPNVGRPSGFWLSLPYNSVYHKASDIAKELGPSKIDIVAKWDAATQKMVIYYYMHGHWRGQDFSIEAGDGLMIEVVSAFDWAINGTDSASSLTFTYKPPPHHNYYWVSLPLTGTITSASELVSAIEGGFGPGTNTKIDAIGKWNYTRQAYDIFRYSATGWGGVNFKLNTGDCVWIEITSSFDWTPPLLTPEIT